MQKPKVLVVNWRDIENPEAGGAEVHYNEIFRRLNGGSFEITVLASKFKGAEDSTVINGVKTVRFSNELSFNYWVYANIGKYVKENCFDLVVDDVNKIPFFINKLTNKPVVALFHHLFGRSIFYECSFLPASYVWLSERLIGPLYKKRPFVAVSKSTFDELKGLGLYESDGAIIHNGIDLTLYTPLPEKRIKNHIVFVGRIKRYKNTGFLVRLFAKLKKEIPDLKMTIAGGGDFLPELKKLAAPHADIVCKGFVTESEKIALYRSASLFINPSIKEGWSITNIESCACGTPVLASDSPGLRDSVHNGENGELFPYDDVDSCVQAAVRMLKDSEGVSSLGKKARLFAEKYSWDNSASQMGLFLEKFL